MEYTVPQPPVDLFLNKKGVDQILAEGQTSWKIEGIDYDNGVHIHVIGAQFPKKGFPTPEAIWAINHVKKTFIESIKILSSIQFVPSLLIFLILPKSKFIEKVISSFNRLAYGAISPFILQDHYMTPIARELEQLILNILLELKISPDSAKTFSQIFSHVIEYDSAYRYRLEDLFSETSPELLQNPRKEIKRLAKIAQDREIDGWVKLKFASTATILQLMLLSSSLSKSIKKSVYRVSFTNLQYDEADRYWCLMRLDYNFIGMTYEQRMKVIEEKGYKVPQQFFVNAQSN